MSLVLRTVPGKQSVLNKRAHCVPKGLGLTYITAVPSEPPLRLELQVLIIFESLGKQP